MWQVLVPAMAASLASASSSEGFGPGFSPFGPEAAATVPIHPAYLRALSDTHPSPPHHPRLPHSRVNHAATDRRALHKAELFRRDLAESVPHRLTRSEDQAVLPRDASERVEVFLNHLAETCIKLDLANQNPTTRGSDTRSDSQVGGEIGEARMDVPILLKNRADQPSVEISSTPPSHLWIILVPGGT
jgi:hypothetical protein